MIFCKTRYQYSILEYSLSHEGFFPSLPLIGNISLSRYIFMASLNRFLDLSSPSMKKFDNGEIKCEQEKKKKLLTVIVATNIVANQLLEC